MTELESGSLWEHALTRLKYRVLGVCDLEGTDRQMVIYRSDRIVGSKMGFSTACPIEDFLDGRFRLAASPSATSDEATDPDIVGDIALRAEIARLGAEMIDAEKRGYARGFAEGSKAVTPVFAQDGNTMIVREAIIESPLGLGKFIDRLKGFGELLWPPDEAEKTGPSPLYWLMLSAIAAAVIVVVYFLAVMTG